MTCPCGYKLCACVEPLEPDLPGRALVFGRGLEWLLGHEFDPAGQSSKEGERKDELHGGD